MLVVDGKAKVSRMRLPFHSQIKLLTKTAREKREVDAKVKG